MSVLFILISCSLLLAVGFLGAFLWASKSGQFEDAYTPSIRILFEDGLPPSEINEKGVKRNKKSPEKEHKTELNKT